MLGSPGSSRENWEAPTIRSDTLPLPSFTQWTRFATFFGSFALRTIRFSFGRLAFLTVMTTSAFGVGLPTAGLDSTSPSLPSAMGFDATFTVRMPTGAPAGMAAPLGRGSR